MVGYMVDFSGVVFLKVCMLLSGFVFSLNSFPFAKTQMCYLKVSVASFLLRLLKETQKYKDSRQCHLSF